MFSNFLKIISPILLLSACATTSTMPEDKYQMFSTLAVGSQKCFESNFMDSKLYADTKIAFGAVLATWTYDRDKLNAMMNSSYPSTNVNSSYCRHIEAGAYQLISNAQQARANAQEDRRNLSNAIQDFNRNMTINKPIYCNKIGTMTMCN